MLQLDFPTYDFKMKSVKGKDQIFDPFRKKWVPLSPEEWVRQHVLQYLHQVCKYPASVIAIEKEIQLGSLIKRFDILIYKNEMPWMIVECKEAKVNLDEKTIEQLLQYQQVLKATYLIASNGHLTIGAKINSGKLYPLDNFPEF